MTASRVVPAALYTAATVLIAAVAAWPVYRDGAFLLLAAVAGAAGAGIAVAASLRRWQAWTVAAVLAGAFTVLAVPLAVPTRLSGPGEILRGLGEAFAGALVGWKDLVTVDLPVGTYRNLLVPALVVFLVGTYRNLLVPALVVFLVGTCLVLRFALRDTGSAVLAVPAAIAMVAFGLLFGRTATSAALPLGPFALAAPVETATGGATLLTALLWLAWRSRDERVRALHRAANASGVRVSRRPSRTDRRRTVLGAAMVSVAVLVSVLVVPAVAAGGDRTVLRSGAGPALEIARALSPLSDYRAAFGADRVDEVLFTVRGDAPERIRLATLDAYDGEVFRSGADAAGAFVRVPSVRDAAAGSVVESEVEIQGWDGIWMPTAGDLVAVDFHGERGPALADAFYYNADAAAGVEIADGGLEAGDVYTLRAVEPPAPALADLEPGGGSEGPAVPDNLSRWVEAHAEGSGGAALAGLVALLRERGFLSHALREADAAAWSAELPGYAFQSSTAGHSLARVDDLFARLLEREADPRAAASGNFVAAVGDDEQFAVAAALIARELGFASRVVVGARLHSDDAELSTCDDGECRGGDLAAWAEVRGADGAWVAVDATPQWAVSPSLEVTEQRDPENVTEVRPDTVEEVVPPEPVQEDAAREPRDDPASGPDLAALWGVLRVVGLSLLALAVVLGPFLVVLGAKATRRRGRRRRGAPASRIAGGWEEYVDAAVDAGRERPGPRTRTELAAAYGGAAGTGLAVAADRAVFSAEATTDDDAESFWRIVDAERRTFAAGFWRRLGAAVSLRSFLRAVAPATGRANPRTVERGRRRPRSRARTTE